MRKDTSLFILHDRCSVLDYFVVIDTVTLSSPVHMVVSWLSFPRVSVVCHGWFHGFLSVPYRVESPWSSMRKQHSCVHVCDVQCLYNGTTSLQIFHSSQTDQNKTQHTCISQHRHCPLIECAISASNTVNIALSCRQSRLFLVRMNQ